MATGCFVVCIGGTGVGVCEGSCCCVVVGDDVWLLLFCGLVVGLGVVVVGGF